MSSSIDITTQIETFETKQGWGTQDASPVTEISAGVQDL